MPRLRHLPQWWLARLKEYYQENSFAYITGLSANQSALSKHSNPNRAPGLGRLMSNTLGRGPSNPWAPRPPPSPPSHHTLGSHWLALIGCIKHSTDFLIILHMVTHGLVPRAADTRTSAALDWSPGFQITTRTQGGKRVSACDCNDCRKYVTRTGDGLWCSWHKSILSLLACGLQHVRPRGAWPDVIALAGYGGFIGVACQKLHCGWSGTRELPKQTLGRSEGKLFWHFKWNTSVSSPHTDLSCAGLSPWWR